MVAWLFLFLFFGQAGAGMVLKKFPPSDLGHQDREDKSRSPTVGVFEHLETLKKAIPNATT